MERLRERSTLSRVAAIVFCLAVRFDVVAQSTVLPGELSWLGLFNRELVTWLENENRLADLCTPADGADKWAECKEAHLEPKVIVILVRSQPRDDATVVGTISVVAVPGRGLRAFASVLGVATAFTPDLYDPDWGYGPYFHQTVLEQRESWFRVPVDPLPPGWVNAATWTDTTDIQKVLAGDIVSTPRGDMAVIGVGRAALRLRPEQPSDRWCGGAGKPRLQPWKEIRIPFAELFNKRGHLLVTKKYTRGC